MPKYLVRLVETETFEYIIDADDEFKAEDVAMAAFLAGHQGAYSTSSEVYPDGDLPHPLPDGPIVDFTQGEPV